MRRKKERKESQKGMEIERKRKKGRKEGFWWELDENTKLAAQYYHIE